MDLNRKIEEIRQKPEHIRLRYIWAFVAISMLFIVTIWVFSLKESAKKLRSENNVALPDIGQGLEEIGSMKNQTPSINEIMENAQDTMPTDSEESILNQQQNTTTTPQNQENFQLPKANN